VSINGVQEAMDNLLALLTNHLGNEEEPPCHCQFGMEYRAGEVVVGRIYEPPSTS
jgi:hypothetical protein